LTIEKKGDWLSAIGSRPGRIVLRAAARLNDVEVRAAARRRGDE
jgi:hypothetical protein